MSKLIAITGTHGTGKTTLSFILAAEYKKLGANVKIIQEVARSCPFPLNENMTKETALWIFHEHSKKELEAIRNHDIVICDRTSFDSFVYAAHLEIPMDIYLIEWAHSHLYEYDTLFYVKPSEKPPLNDGTRSIDLQFQSQIDTEFKRYLSGIDLEKIDSSLIFKEDYKWNMYL
jgi:thymidylate kinase